MPGRYTILDVALIASLSVLTALSGSDCRSGSPERPAVANPNLILISVDTLRADHLSAYGSDVSTPHIDGIAGAGTLFEHVQTVAPTTLPSHASLFTGLYPFHHGVRDNVGFYLGTEVPTLASELRDHGYRTGGFVGAFVMDGRFGIGRGFEEYFDAFDTSTEEVLDSIVAERRGGAVLDRTLAWLETVADERFFAFLHLYDPHAPYQPPPEFAAAEAGDRQRYAGEVRYVDSLVGRLLYWIESRGLSERTLVALTADHGEALGDHGEPTHGFFLYQETLHVPLLLRGPGVPEGTRIDDLVRLVDLMPTLLDLLDAPAPEALDGVSLRPLLEDPDNDLELSAYAETLLPRLCCGWSELRALRRNDTKFILAPQAELYDLTVDPGERINQVQRRPRQARRMRSELERLDAETIGNGVPEPAVLGHEAVERLRALGYLSGGAPRSGSLPYHRLPDPKDRIEVYRAMNNPGLVRVSPGDPQGYTQALATLRSLLRENPTVPRLHGMYGELLLRGGRAEAAAEAFRSLLAVQPGSFSGNYGLASALLDQGELAGAEDRVQAAIELEPRNTKGHFLMARIQLRRSRPRAAQEWLRRALELHSDQVVEEKLVEALILSGETDDVEEAVRRAASLVRRDGVGPLNVIIESLVGDGHRNEAVDLARHVKDRLPRNGDAYLGYGNALFTTGHVAASVEAYRHAIDLTPCPAEAQANLGTAYLAMEQPERAVEALEAALECNDGHVSAWTNLAAARIRTGSLDGAIEALQAALRLQPDNSHLARQLRELLEYRRRS